LNCVHHTVEPHQEERPAARENRDRLKVRSPTRILGQWRSFTAPSAPGLSLLVFTHLHLHLIRVSSGLITSRFLSHPHWSVFAYPYPLPGSDPSFVPSSLLSICEPMSVCTTLLTIYIPLQPSVVMFNHVLDLLARPSCFGTTATAEPGCRLVGV
jgi:hypothetical protein